MPKRRPQLFTFGAMKTGFPPDNSKFYGLTADIKGAKNFRRENIQPILKSVQTRDKSHCLGIHLICLRETKNKKAAQKADEKFAAIFH
jgi:hypothetical protein